MEFDLIQRLREGDRNRNYPSDLWKALDMEEERMRGGGGGRGRMGRNFVKGAGEKLVLFGSASVE